ncbi:MAG: peptide-methionine (S)-S-oxide reductase MsrA [Saprospiraceae bacterium]|nr:peptide-methionine (S)-S-oxide reductase MsrA [Saprospiraceae bacterium]
MKSIISIGLILLTFTACSQKVDNKSQNEDPDMEITPDMNTDTATFGAGCFWCVEAIFQELKGVLKVEAGYSGGHVENPTYRQVCSKNTGHAEVTRIVYDPDVISYEELLEVFWTTHDPTTPNRQGADVGPQYRSVIFYHDDRQKEIALKSKKEVGQPLWEDEIVTEIAPLTNYYVAEDYHQNYYSQNPNQGYCRVVINPKVQKFREKFADKLKDSE